MKVLFLDFDGVITTYDSRWCIDTEKLNLIDKIIQQTDAKIVVSSSWKVGNENVEDFKERIGMKGVPKIQKMKRHFKNFSTKYMI